MTVYSEGLINGRWPVVLPEHRIYFHQVHRPTWEKERIDHMADHLTEGMTVYDLGAECADFSCLYRQWVGASGEVVMFEPSLPYWPEIRQTWEANGLPVPRFTFPGFASHITDLAPVHCPDGMFGPYVEGWPACSVGEIQPDFGFRHLSQDTERTPQTTLDDFATATGLPPDVLVCDSEGSEWHVMDGCRGLLADRDLLVYISVHPETMGAWYGKTEDDLADLMAEYGYFGNWLGTHGGEYFVVLERGLANPTWPEKRTL